MKDDLGARESGGGKVAVFAIAIALVLGAVFYGLTEAKRTNHPSVVKQTEQKK